MESQTAEIDRLAEKAGLTRSRYIVQRALDRTDEHVVARARAKKRNRKVA
jgi:hypothetical protein